MSNDKSQHDVSINIEKCKSKYLKRINHNHRRASSFSSISSQQTIALLDDPSLTKSNQQNVLISSLTNIECNTNILPPNYDSGIFTRMSIDDNSIDTTTNSTLTKQSSTEDEDFELESNHLYQRLSNLKNHSISSSYSDEFRRLKSELERIRKSEQWYKDELKLQKHIRLELLERLYLNEHKFIKENQNLKIECDRLNRMYKDLEYKYDEEKDHLTKKLHELEKISLLQQFSSPNTNTTSNNNFPTNISNASSFNTAAITTSVESLTFESQKYKHLYNESEKINNLLRKQKSALFNDLNVITNERDRKIALLESKLIILDGENIKITQKYAKLSDENQKLHDKYNEAEKLLIKARNDLEKFDRIQEQFDVTKIANDFALKDLSLFSCQSTNENNSKDTMLLTTQNISEKCDLCCFNESVTIPDLKSEIIQLTQIHQEHFELLEQNKIQLETKDEEIQELHQILNRQTDYIQTLQEEIAEYKKLRENSDKYVQLLENNSLELEAKQTEIDNLKANLIEIQLQSKEYLQNNEHLQNCIEKLNRIRENLELQINENSRENYNLVEKINSLKSHIELNLFTKNEKMAYSKEAEDLRKVIKNQSEKILQQKCELDECRKKCDELCNILQFERSEFAKRRQSLKIQKEQEFEEEAKSGAEINKTKNTSVISGLSNETSKSSYNSKSHRVSINLQLYNEDIPSTASESDNPEFEKHFHNIEILKTLLEQKSEKMTILCEEQQKWEKLLENLQEKNHKTDKFDEKNILNDLEIQEEITELKESLKIKSEQIKNLIKELKIIKNEHSQEIEELIENHKKSEKLIKDELNGKLIDFENFKPLLSEQEKKLKNLREALMKSQKENEELLQKLIKTEKILEDFESKIKQLESDKLELVEIAKKLKNGNSKNQQEKVLDDDEAERSDDTATDDDHESNKNISDDVKNFKVMKKVMENEHRKNIKRYELHIRTLLSNIKSNKKNMETLENRYEQLKDKYKQLEIELKNKRKLEEEENDEKGSEQTIVEDDSGVDLINEGFIEEIGSEVKCIKCLEFEDKIKDNAQKLLDIESQCEKSEKLIKKLEYQLETAKKQFLEIDEYKRINKMLTVNLTNLMNDYKKKILEQQQRNDNSYNKRYTILFNSRDDDNDVISNSNYDDIMNLIEKSNVFVPNFNNLKTSIDEVKEDLIRFKNSNNNIGIGGLISANYIIKRSPSLAEELKAAAVESSKF